MNKTALHFITLFLEELNNRFANDGSNDFEIPNTADNIQLLRDAISWNYRKMKEKERNEIIDEIIMAVEREAEGKTTILINNATLCGYLAYLAKQEAEGS